VNGPGSPPILIATSNPGKAREITGLLAPLRLAIVAIPAWVTIAALIFHIGWRTKMIIALALGVSLASPVHGLLFAAALAPLGLLIAALVGDPNFRIGEAVVVAFLIGWLLRALPDRRGPAVAAPLIGWLFAVTVVASITAVAWQIQAYPDALSGAVSHIVFAYYYPTGDWIGAVTGARLLEGLGLAAATVTLFRRSPSMANRVPLVLAGSATIAAASSVLLSYGIGSASALQRLAQNGYRVSGHVADPNAAGSYFAMVACLAMGMAVHARWRGRALWMIMAIATIVGLRMSQSRSALAAAAMVAAVAVASAATSRFTLRTRGALLAVVLLLGAGAGAVRVRQIEKDPDFRGAGFRTQFNTTSARMIAARPIVGVGIGQYYRTSPLFLSPQLAWSYGFENACWAEPFGCATNFRTAAGAVMSRTFRWLRAFAPGPRSLRTHRSGRTHRGIECLTARWTLGTNQHPVPTETPEPLATSARRSRLAHRPAAAWCADLVRRCRSSASGHLRRGESPHLVQRLTCGFYFFAHTALPEAGADVVLDNIGGALGEASFGLVAAGGRFSAHGTPSGRFAQIDRQAAQRDGITVTGIEAVQMSAADLKRYTELALREAAAGVIAPVIGQTFPLAEASAVHAAIEGRQVFGKTLLTTRE